MRFVVTRLKVHATLWWESVQAESRNRNKHVIKNWDRMVSKLKGKLLKKDYQLRLYRQLQNLEQKSMTVSEYTK